MIKLRKGNFITKQRKELNRKHGRVMEEKYIAHVKENSEETQSVLLHSINTGNLSRSFSISQLKDLNQEMGLRHDIGKYQLSFQNRIRGANIKVEHSICGAQEIRKKYHDAAALMMELCIAGHHGGIPDCGFPNVTEDLPTLEGRLKRRTKDDFSAYEKEIMVPSYDHNAILRFLLEDCNACLKKINLRLSGFVCKTELQKARAELQNRVFTRADTKAGIYLMNMPTGSGKTLCSMKFALKRLIKTNKKELVLPVMMVVRILHRVLCRNTAIYLHRLA